MSLERLSKDRAILRFCLFGIVSVGLHICFLFSVGFFDCFQLPDFSAFALSHETPPPPGQQGAEEKDSSCGKDKDEPTKENLANSLSKEKDLPLPADGKATASGAVVQMPTTGKGPQPINLVPNEKGKILERSRWCSEPQWSPDGRYILTAVKSLNVKVQETKRNGRAALAIGAPRIFVNAVLLDARSLKVIEQFNRGPFRGSFDRSGERLCLRDMKYKEGALSHLFLYDIKTHRMDFLSNRAVAGSISPDGARVFCLSPSNVSVINIGKKKELSGPATADTFANIKHSEFAWSDDSRYCAVIATDNAKGAKQYIAKVFDSASLHQVANIPLGLNMPGTVDERFLAFLPDNRCLAFRCQYGFEVKDVRTGSLFLNKPSIKLLPAGVLLSPDRSTLLCIDGNETRAFDPDTMAPLFAVQMKDIARGPYSCAWSHDSASILFKTSDSVLIYRVKEKILTEAKRNIFPFACFGPDDKTIECYGGGYMASSSKI